MSQKHCQQTWNPEYYFLFHRSLLICYLELLLPRTFIVGDGFWMGRCSRVRSCRRRSQMARAWEGIDQCYGEEAVSAT